MSFVSKTQTLIPANINEFTVPTVHAILKEMHQMTQNDFEGQRSCNTCVGTHVLVSLNSTFHSLSLHPFSSTGMYTGYFSSLSVRGPCMVIECICNFGNVPYLEKYAYYIHKAVEYSRTSCRK